MNDDKKQTSWYILLNDFSTERWKASKLFYQRFIEVKRTDIGNKTSHQSKFRNCNVRTASVLIKILASIPISQFWSIPINANFLLMPWSGIDRNWEEFIGIERHFGSMSWFWSTLIGIGHWSRGSCNVIRYILNTMGGTYQKGVRNTKMARSHPVIGEESPQRGTTLKQASHMARTNNTTEILNLITVRALNQYGVIISDQRNAVSCNHAMI